MNILLLATYPIDTPLHGGQLRVSNIAAAYRRAGHQVEVCGVLGSSSYPGASGFLPYPGAELLMVDTGGVYGLMDDWAIGRRYAVNADCFEGLAAIITTKPDIIHVEQPFLFAFAKRYAATCCTRPTILYGSQNIEFRLKNTILKNYIEPGNAARCAELIEKIEIEASREADGVVCVSQHDFDWSTTVTDVPVLLAPNGVNPWQATAADLQYARKVSGGKRFALFCASAHPPNMKGFFDMFGGGFGSLTPDQVLIVAGGAGEHIASGDQVHQSAKLAARITVAGVVSNGQLAGLLELAHCIVVPITQGGGTNLKTAEALWSGRYVVATPVAMRGFERFYDVPGVFIASSAAEFKRSLRQAMQSPALQLDVGEREARRSVLWENCLAPLPAFAAGLAQRKVV